MRAPRRPFPSFTLAMTDDMDSTSIVPLERPSQVFRYQPYQPTHRPACRVTDCDDSLRTGSRRLNEPSLREASLDTIRFAPNCDLQQDAESAVVHLHRAIHTTGNGRQGHSGTRLRRISMTTLVIDLALAVRRKIANFHAARA